MSKKIQIKVAPKTKMVGVRVTQEDFDKLKKLANKHNSSQATIAGFIISNEIEHYE